MKIKLIVLVLAASILSACDNPSAKPELSTDNAQQHPAELQQFIQQIKSHLVFVQGGDFLMGDFGRQYGKEKMFYDSHEDSSPLHKVELSSYSIGKFKTTNQEYQTYLRFNHLKLRVIDNELTQARWDEYNKLPNTPAHMDWHEADKYCRWLADVTKLPFSLPTEAQWEYAARSRGQFLIVATDDGTFKVDGQHGINMSSSADRHNFAKKMGLVKTNSMASLPVDSYPPNPLGLYDMSGNGYEWIKDWYDPDYYQHSSLKDPQGPEKPTFKSPKGYYLKVMRNIDLSNPSWGNGLTVARSYTDPDNYGMMPADKTVRCVVNSPDKM